MTEERDALTYALQNAVEHGEAQMGPVMSRLLGDHPELKRDIESAKGIASAAAEEANGMSPEEREDRLRELDPEFFEEEEEERELPDLPGDTSDPKLRFAPNPSGPLHVGHARAAVLNDHYSERYDGTLILRIEDTDPGRVDPDAYTWIEEDLDWLGVAPDKTIVQSDRLDLYHDHARRLLEIGGAYVCTCPEEEFRELKNDAEPCPCRDNSVEENLDRFEHMFAEYGEGDAVVRIRTDIEHEDPAMRDFPVMRISEAEHPRVDARVYPLMNLSVAVDDHLLGVTHVIRGKDHIANTRRQRFIYDHLDWEPPEFVHHGHLHIEGLVLSTSTISEGIADGEFAGWDDVALGTLRALDRRGIAAEALRETVLSHGLSENDAEFSWINLYSANRDAIDDDADRYFYVPDPSELRVDGPGATATPPLHPDHEERGTREIPVPEDPALLLPSRDVDDLSKGDRLRLKDLYNVRITSTDPLEAEHIGNDLSLLEEGIPILQWLPQGSPTATILRTDGHDTGAVESNVAELDEGAILQFERYGFCRLDDPDSLTFCFAHR